jgi:FtsZ-binding cell division protein ZapB
MCKVQSAVEDCLERIEELETDADSLRNTITSCQLTIKELQAENARLRQEMGDG